MSTPQFFVPGAPTGGGGGGAGGGGGTPAGWQSVGTSRSPMDGFGTPSTLDPTAVPPSASVPFGVPGPYARPGMVPGGGGMGGFVPTMGVPAGGVGMGMGVQGAGVGMGGGSAAGGASPFNDVLFGAGSGFIRSGLGAYGERLLGSGRDYVRSNMDKYFSSTDVQYYFQVSHLYVRNKLKVLLCPFLHKGHWTRIAEQVAGGLTYKPPRYDINAPDLYIPFVAFLSYVVLGGFALGLQHKFSPGVMNARVTRGLIGWALETLLLRSVLYALGGGEAPLLDLVAYGGYACVGWALNLLGWVVWRHSFYPLLVWNCLCMAMFLVKTMKRVLFTETRHYERDSTRHRYMLLLTGAAQFPLALWLCKL